MADIDSTEHFKHLRETLNEDALSLLDEHETVEEMAVASAQDIALALRASPATIKPSPSTEPTSTTYVTPLPPTLWLGQVDYVQSLLPIQTARIAEGLNYAPQEKIDGLEYPLTITLGKRADPLRDIRAPMRTLRERNIPIVAVDRGGQATLHNPGQLVIYPQINLRERSLKVKEFVSLVENVTKNFLFQFGIEAFCKGDEPGLYTLKGKIAFFGIRVQRGFTSHGLSINVRNSLEDFGLIRSCGKNEDTFSRMQDYGVTAPLSYLFSAWCSEFEKHL